MIYYIYRTPEGHPSVHPYKLNLDLLPGFVLVEEVESSFPPRYDFMRWIDNKWVNQDPIPQKVRDRMALYPSAISLLELLWDGMESGEIAKASAFYQAMKTIRDQYR